MRVWHLILLTVGACLVILLQEAPNSTRRTGDFNQQQREAGQLLSVLPKVTRHSQEQTDISHVPSVEFQPLKDLSVGRRSLVDAQPASAAAAQSAMGNSSEHHVVTAVSTKPQISPFMVLGVVSNCMWPPPGDGGPAGFAQQHNRRRWIRETFMTYPNVGKTMDVKFIVGMLQSNLNKIPHGLEEQVRGESRQNGDMVLLETVPERKSPCLKTMAWYRWATTNYPKAVFIAKTDDDAFVATIKLESNMRRFAGNPLLYVGSTLWGTYITKTFEACARRLGPMMALGGMTEEKCAERGAIGPYPYAVGMLQVLSHELASWMVVQPSFLEFERRATAATRPPMMDHGEDMVIGMFLYQHPGAVMPLHWGWDKLHDLCFECKRKDQIWRPITHQTVVAHHVANEIIINDVFRNVTRTCDDKCQQAPLPFEVTSLQDLCSRGQISRVYSKCDLVAKRKGT